MSGAGRPSKRTCVPPAVVSRKILLTTAGYARASGPKVVPKIVTSSPGETPFPAWKLAALTIPPADMAVVGATPVTVAFADFVVSPKEVAVIVTVTGWLTTAGAV